MSKPIFILHHENGDTVADIPWNAVTAGRVFIGLVGLGVVVFGLIQFLNGAWWEAPEIATNAVILAVLAYLGTACLRNCTRVQLNSDGSVRISHGPLPLMPGSLIPKQDLAYVQAYRRTTPESRATVHRVDLVTCSGQRNSLRVGGCDSREEAEQFEHAMREFLKLPQKPPMA